LDAIESAARLLAGARAEGHVLPGLPEELRPATLEAAEAIQAATLRLAGETVGGWKAGRQEGHAFVAPIPASRVTLASDELLPMPASRFLELELAIRFPVDIPPAEVARLTPDDLPGLAQIATLIELVQVRLDPSAANPLDRIADGLSNHGAVVRPSDVAWTLDLLDRPPPTVLTQDGRENGRRDDAHPAAPVRGLLDGYLDRCRRDGRGIAAGEVVTLGSLTGMPAIPAEGASYVGTIEGLDPVRCRVAPVG